MFLSEVFGRAVFISVVILLSDSFSWAAEFPRPRVEAERSRQALIDAKSALENSKQRESRASETASRLRKQVKSLKKQVKYLEKDELHLRRQDFRSIRRKAHHYRLEEGLPLSASLRDQMTEYFFDTVLKPEKSVFLALGDGRGAGPDQISRLAKEICYLGFVVVYDADSEVGPLIRKAAPKGRRLGISGRAGSESEDILVIENPYIRLKSILSIEKIIVSPSSVTGLGLLVHRMAQNGKRFLVWPEDEVESLHGLSNWTDGLLSELNDPDIDRRALCFSSSKNPKGLDLRNHEYLKKKPLRYWVEDWLGLHLTDRPKFLPSFKFRKLVRQIPPSNLQEVLEAAEQYQELFEGVEKGGAVVFGSTWGPAGFRDQVRTVTEVVVGAGYSITTGGGAGYQELANSVAYVEPEGRSIGISIENPSWDLPETEAAVRDTHHETVTVNGYTQRIPLLLKERELVVFMPGDTDTMRELASVLVELGSGRMEGIPIVFVSEYYLGLVEWLKGLPLPERVKGQIKLVSSAEEIAEIFEESL